MDYFHLINLIKLLIFLLMLSNSYSISGYVPISGKSKMYYEQKGEGEPVIFLHGHSLDTRMWDPQWEVFAKKYHVIRLDFRGYGKSSDQIEDFQFTHVDDLIELMNYLKIEKAHIIGLSMGSKVAGDMLAMYPERMLSCTMCSASIHGAPGPSTPITEEERAQREKEIEDLKKKGIDNYKKEWHKMLMSSGGSQREKMSLPLYHMIKDWSVWQQLHREIRCYYGNEAWDELKRKGTVDVPTLLVRGENDVKYKNRVMSELKCLPNGLYVIVKDCGHMLNMDRVDEFNELVLNFLENIKKN